MGTCNLDCIAYSSNSNDMVDMMRDFLRNLPSTAAAQYLTGKQYRLLRAEPPRDWTSWETFIHELPELPNIIPHWIIESDALAEIRKFSETEEGKVFVNDCHIHYPIHDGMIMEIKSHAKSDYSFVLVYAPPHTRAHHYIMKHAQNMRSEIPVEVRDGKAFLAIYAAEEHLRWMQTEYGEQDGAVAARELIQQVYAIRCHFAQRFIDRDSKGLKKQIPGCHAAGVRIITVYWDAPTPRYNHRTDPDRVPSGIHMPEHEVRSHERHYKSGRVTIIKSHKRGDAAVPRKTQIRLIGHGDQQ